ncbi:unnamed protein product, partial [Mesorhabditis spiculigera]
MMADAKQKITEGELLSKRYSAKSRMAELTVEQLGKFPANTPAYQTMGRMFVLTNIADEMTRHKEESKEHKEKIVGLVRQKEYLQKNVEDSERNLREMVQSRRH